MEVLQMWFYILAIIFMLSLTIVFVMVGVVLFQIQRLVKEAPERIQSGLSSLFDTDKMKFVSMIGLPVATFLLSRVKGFFSRK
jgi:hypothetical protein